MKKLSFSRIKPPKFYIGRSVLNEYELLQIMAEVAKGARDPEGVIVRDEYGNTSPIRHDGRLMNDMPTFGKQSGLHLDIIYGRDQTEKERRKKKKFPPIKPPAFFWDGLTLNEYEARKLQVDVASGKRKANKIDIRDEEGNVFTIIEDGTFKTKGICSRIAPKGYEVASSFTLELIRIRREKRA